MKVTMLLATICWTMIPAMSIAGPFTNTGIPAADPGIVAWADTVVNFSPTTSGSAPAAASGALGPAGSGLVSLGDLTQAQIDNNVAPGSITLSFSRAIRNGTGWDLAVFENAGQFFPAPHIFGELAYVEVSSDNNVFARFPNDSLNVESGGATADDNLNVAFGRNFAGINPTNVRNLAGIHPLGTGTAFDFADLINNPFVLGGQVNLDSIKYVRLVDVPGNGAFVDSSGRPIFDTWVTTGSGGLDLDAVAAHYVVPEPSGLLLAAAALISLMMSSPFISRRTRRNSELRAQP